MASPRRGPVEWAVARRCRRGEATSGDLAVVSVLPEGALVAGIDGLGHGAEAARAAQRAADVVRERPSPDLVACWSSACHVGSARHARRGDQPGLRLPLRPRDDLARRRQRRGSRAQRRPVGDRPEGLARAARRRPRARAAAGEARDAPGRAGRRARPGDRRHRRAFADALDISGSTAGRSASASSPTTGSPRTMRSSWRSAISGRVHDARPQHRDRTVPSGLCLRAARPPARSRPRPRSAAPTSSRATRWAGS